MTDYIVGPGVAQAIADAGDEARTDEMAIATDDEGWAVTQTVGRDALYYWIRADNKVSRLPFE